MTQERPLDKGLTQMDDERVLQLLGDCKEQEKGFRDLRQRIEYEVLTRLESRGATEMASAHWVAKLIKPTPQYDQGKLMALKEEVSPTEWDKAFTPEHMELVPAKLDMRVAGGWGKRFGTEVAQALDRARLPSGPGTLKIIENERELTKAERELKKEEWEWAKREDREMRGEG